MKKVILKVVGVLVIVSIVAVSSINTTSAQLVSMDSLNVRTMDNLDQVLTSEHPWTFISSEYVYKGTKKTRFVAPQKHYRSDIFSVQKK